MRSFTFSGTRKPYVIPTHGIDRPLFASRDLELHHVKGRAGAYLQGVTTHVREINVPIFLRVRQGENMQLLKEELAEWLHKEEPKPLTFDDEPDRVYYAIVDNVDFDDWFNWGEGVIHFICPDPYKYGHQRTVDRRVEQYITNEGTAESFPVIKLKPSMDTSRIIIKNYSNLTPFGTPKSVALGYPRSPSQEEVDPLELVMHDTMQSTSGWQTATDIDNGYIAGQMEADSRGFYAGLFGGAIDMKRWQGPSLIRGIGETLQDFQADIYIKQFNIGKETGMIEVYFRDANGNRVAKIGFEDPYINSEENQGKARIGAGNDYHDIYTKADEPYGWNNFDGLLRITREDDVWRPYFAQIMADGTHNWVKGNLKYVDVDEKSIAPVTHVQVAIRKYPGTEETDMTIKEIKIYRINMIENYEEQVPLSFKEGDHVEINCATGLVLVNGTIRTDLIGVETIFFSLLPGKNNVDSNFPFEITWTERYL